MVADIKVPDAIYAHGFLSINGEKMSKSRGTFIKAQTYIENLDPEYLRYYFAYKLDSNIDDIDLNFDDFKARVNSDLIGKVINIASRCASLLGKYFDNNLAKKFPDNNLYENLLNNIDNIKNLYQKREFSQAMRNIMLLTDKVNQYINDTKPWALIKEENNKEQVREILTLGINAFKILIIFLKPVLPKTAADVEKWLGLAPQFWQDIDKTILNKKINTFTPLLSRIEDKQIKALVI